MTGNLTAGSDRDELREYFIQAVRGITRPAKGYLKHPYLVPGGSYQEQLWDWDSFWITTGILALPEDVRFEEGFDPLVYATGSWKNFFENQRPNGAIPILSMPHNADVFGGTADEFAERNQAKPVLAQFALAIAEKSGEYEWLRPYFDKLLLFFERWTTTYMSPCGLLVWGSDVAIGVDNDPTAYGRPDFSSGNLLLNCLFYKDLQAAARIAERLDLRAEMADLNERAEKIGEAVRLECWDPIDGFYYSVDVQCEDLRDKHLAGHSKGMDMHWKTLPLKVKVFTGFLPMWCGIATTEQAKIMVERHLGNAEEFASPFGIRTLAQNEKMYSLDLKTSNPSNWLGPVWILPNYLVYRGLLNYGFDEAARDLAAKTERLLRRDIALTGTLHECYHPETGDPNFNAGFLSWNVLALSMRK